MTAAVFVSSKAQPRTPAEMDALRKMVVNALGIKSTDEKESAKVVTIEEVAFATSPVEKTTAIDFALQNSDLLKNGLAILAALALIFVFFRMLKRTKPDEIPIEILDQSRLIAAPVTPTAEAVSVEMLNDMITDKPENIGAALRGWMGAGGKS